MVKYHYNGEIGLIMANDIRNTFKVLFPSGIWGGCDPEGMEVICEGR